MKPQTSSISIYVAILALVVSSISLWISYQNREHDRLVAYEQRRQEVRQLFLEGELLTEKLESATLEHVKTDRTPELREEAAKIWRKATEIHREMKEGLKRFESLPATSETAARIKLETIFTDQLQANKQLREMIEISKQLHGAKHENKF